MDILDKIKKEPRMIIAAINFISFFLPWISVNVSVKVGGVSADGSSSVSGFGMISYSIVGVVFFAIPIVLLLTPFLKQIENYAKYIYLILPIVALILMFMIGAIIGGGSAEAGGGSSSASADVDKLIGYWIALVCNIAVIGYTLIKDCNIKSGEDIKRSIQNIDMTDITTQMQNKAKEIGNNVQQSVFTECPSCGNRISKGKKFCAKCGARVIQEEKQPEQKVKCSVCGFSAIDDTKFCPNCGNELLKPSTIKCPNCGSEVSGKNKFCVQCGASLLPVERSVEQVKCSKCATLIAEGMKFCPNCGNSVYKE